ncbi:hypothetical protein [Aeoliella straminimaris]|uniref:hypothetical protein n=1 Tax=Aeoliella straminimaris TaxID=2954799 RepID=UPI0020921B7A|nr:hypothetical protein [Aeoliella straminimaris]
MTRITYQWLFAYLEQLGFVDTSPSDFERVFEHQERDILLAFSLLDDRSVDRPVRAADFVSVEFRLQQEGLLSGTLNDAELRQSKS